MSYRVPLRCPEIKKEEKKRSKKREEEEEESDNEGRRRRTNMRTSWCIENGPGMP